MPVPAPIVVYGTTTLAANLNSFVSGHFDREDARIARRENFIFQEGLDSKR